MNIFNWIIILLLSLLAGFADSKGFYFASQIWPGGSLDLIALLKSGGAFVVGLIFYWGTIFFMNKVGLNSASFQTAIWFIAVIIGVSIATGDFMKWQSLDKIVAVVTVICFLFLLVRNGN